jgi:hypothetical protein
MWNEMRQVAERERVSLLAVSGAMTLQVLHRITAVGRGALSSVKVTGTLVDWVVVGHYRDALRDVQQRGLWNVVSQVSESYIDAVWRNFHTGRPTITEDVVSGRLLGRVWRSMWGWLRRRSPGDSGVQPPASPAAVPEAPQPEDTPRRPIDSGACEPGSRKAP